MWFMWTKWCYNKVLWKYKWSKKNYISCASKLGILGFSPNFTDVFKNDILEMTEPDLKCKRCGYTFNDYLNTGFFGCADCYNTFKNKLNSVLLNFHGHFKHKESENKNSIKEKSDKLKNKNISDNSTIIKKESGIENVEELKKILKLYVQNEEYEKAAVIRDKIKKIERK